MKLNKCHLCNKLTGTPIHITDIKDDGTVESYNVCKKCGEEIMNQLEGNKETPVPTTKSLDLSNVTTPEQLLNFMTETTKENTNKPPCECGMTEENFDEFGKFGCPKCYKHFSEKMEELVFPYHKGARSHAGKKPRRGYIESLMADPVEKMKILKLRYAKALELENYEKAAEIKKEIDDLTRDEQPPEVSSDQ